MTKTLVSADKTEDLPFILGCWSQFFLGTDYPLLATPRAQSPAWFLSEASFRLKEWPEPSDALATCRPQSSCGVLQHLLCFRMALRSDTFSVLFSHLSSFCKIVLHIFFHHLVQEEVITFVKRNFSFCRWLPIKTYQLQVQTVLRFWEFTGFSQEGTRFCSMWQCAMQLKAVCLMTQLSVCPFIYQDHQQKRQHLWV